MADGKIVIKMSAEEKEFRKELMQAEKDAKKYGNKIDKYNQLLETKRRNRMAEFDASGAQQSYDKAKKVYENFLKGKQETFARQEKLVAENPNLDKAYKFSLANKDKKGFKGLLSANLKKWDIDKSVLNEYKGIREKLLVYASSEGPQKAEFEKAKGEYEAKKGKAETPTADMKRWATILDEVNIDYLQTLQTIDELSAKLDEIEEQNKRRIAQMQVIEALRKRATLLAEKEAEEAKRQAELEAQKKAEQQRRKEEAQPFQEEWKKMDEEGQRKLEEEYEAHKFKEPSTGVQARIAENEKLRESLKKTSQVETEVANKSEENSEKEIKADKRNNKHRKKSVKHFDFLRKRIDKVRRSLGFLGFQMKTALLWGVVLMPLMKIFDAIRENLFSVSKQSNAFVASLANLKGTIWTATAPAMQALTGILTNFMNKLAYVITYISTFVNAMLGLSKVSKKTVQNMAKAKDAAKAGKDKDLSFASWDTVQQLNKKTGGAGADEDVIPPTFEQDFSDAEALLEKFRRILSEEGWYGVGEAIGNSLNTVLQNIDTWINEKLWPSLTNFSAQFASFLNGAMSGIDWGLLGKTVGDGLATILDSIDVFLESFSAVDLGKSIAKFFQGIDVVWLAKSLGSVLKNALLFIPKMVIGFVEEMDWATLPGKIFDSIAAFFEGFSISDVVGVIGELVASLIKGAFELVFGATSEITSWLWESASGMGSNIAEGIGSGLGSWFDNIVTWVKENIFKPFIDGFKKVFGIHSPSKEMEPIGDYIGQGILEGLLKPFKNIKDWLHEHIFWPIWSGICKVFGIDANDSEKMEEIGNALSNGLTGGFEAAVEKVKSVLNKIISAVETAVNWIIGKLNKLHVDAPDWMKERFGVEGVGFDFNEIHIPRLAQGGVVNPGHEFAAILGDNRREQEIVSPLSTMKEALMEALRDSGAYHGGNITLEIDGQTFARITNPYLQNETKRIGIIATGG